jgi:uncharacterized protein
MAAAKARELDLTGLRLAAGEGRRLELDVEIDPVILASQRYVAEPATVPVHLEISRMLGGGYALRLRFAAAVTGPCMRCLKDAAPRLEVEAREVSSPGGRGGDGDDELQSPYLADELLDLSAWAHDAFALAVPAKVLCREDCLGLCPQCAADLNEAGPDHRHEREPDPRWEALRGLRLE